MTKFEEEVANSKVFYALVTQNESLAKGAPVEVQQILQEFEIVMTKRPSPKFSFDKRYSTPNRLGSKIKLVFL